MSSFKYTRFTRTDGNCKLGKTLSIKEDGTLKKEPNGDLSEGWAERVHAYNLSDLVDQLEALKDDQAIAVGTIRSDIEDNKVPVVTAKEERTLPKGSKVIARTKKNLVYSDDPALILLDYDAGDAPPETKKRVEELGGPWGAVCHVLPLLINATHVTRASTSTGLLNNDTGMSVPGSDGQHGFIVGQHGNDSRRFLHATHARAWIADLGWGKIGRAGQFLECSIVDRSVGSPERLVFEAPPICVDPLFQDKSKRKPVYVEGKVDVVDTLAVCPPLTVREQHLYKQAIAKEKQRLRPVMQEQRATFIKEEVAAILKRSPIKQKEAERIAELKADKRILLPEQVLISAEFGQFTVASVLADPQSFAGVKIADPIEGPGYGASTAQIMLHYDGRPWIFSYAHGETHYELKHDHRTIQHAIDAAELEQKLDALLQTGVWAVVSPAEIDNICGKLAKLLKTTTRTAIRKTLEQAQKAKWQEIAEYKAERALDERTDPRPIVELPNRAGEYLPVMKQLNDVLGAVSGDEPPMRNTSEGRLQVKRPRESSSMHALTAAGANGEEAEEDRLPPPPHVQLVVLSQEEVAELIERYINYVNGDGESVHLQGEFVKHFMRRKDGVLPEVLKIVTMPIVPPNGEIMAKSRGIDRERRLIYHIDAALVEGLPNNTTDKAVADAMRYLFDIWWCDVSASHEGKCILLAAALSVLERQLIDQRPVFFVTAGRRGSGKTTALQMLLMAVTGRRGACAAWSTDPEERKKSLFAMLREHIECALWDNIPRGHTVSGREFEVACTSETMTDRILGVSEHEEVSCAAIQMFTGNNIEPRGDLASRALCVELVSDRVDPENRDFSHNDPIGWTEANRLQILRALYTILLGNPQLKQPLDASAETRFKQWWRLVGSAVEHASRLVVGEKEAIKFAQVFLEQEEEQDEESVGLVGMFAMLANFHFRPGKPAGDSVTAEEVARFMAGEAGVLRTNNDWLSPEDALVFHEVLYPGKMVRPNSASDIGKRLKKFRNNKVKRGTETYELKVYKGDDHSNVYAIEVTEKPVTCGRDDAEIETAYLSCLSWAEAKGILVKRSAEQFVTWEPMAKIGATKGDIRAAEGRLLKQQRIEVRNWEIHHPPPKAPPMSESEQAARRAWEEAERAKACKESDRRSAEALATPSREYHVASPGVSPPDHGQAEPEDEQLAKLREAVKNAGGDAKEVS
jgi:hypothetical protein